MIDKDVLDDMTNDFQKLGLSYALALIERLPVEVAVKEIRQKIKELEK